MIRFPCAKCNREFAVDNSCAGQAGSCSWCGAAMTVPQPYAEGTRTDDTRDPELVQAPVAGSDDNPFQLAQYRNTNQQPANAGGRSFGGGYQAGCGVVVVLIIIRVILALLRER